MKVKITTHLDLTPAMQNGADVADALHVLARQIESGPPLLASGKLFIHASDTNVVGSFKVKES